MNFSAPFIARPIATMLLAFGLLLVGRRRLPLPAGRAAAERRYPDDRRAREPAGRRSPETMANSIAAPLERRLGEIPGVTEITSTSSVGATAIVIQFDIDRDIDGAAHDVQAAINAATSDLPSDLPQRPYYRKVNPADAPILTLALTSDTLSTARRSTTRRTRSSASGCRRRQASARSRSTARRSRPCACSSIPCGSPPPGSAGAGRLYRDPQRQRAANRPAASRAQERAETIGVNGQISQAADYAPLVLKAGNGAILRLSDVADGRERRRQLAARGLGRTAAGDPAVRRRRSRARTSSRRWTR